MIKGNYIVFDTETGGLDENKNPITQYAAMILDGRTLKEIDRWETFVKPYNNLVIEKDALEKTMVSMSDINSGMKVNDFINTAVKWWESHRTKTKKKEIGRLIPVGHNIPFDIRMMNYALNYCGKSDMTEWMFPNFIDTLALAKIAFGVTGDEKINLTASCEKVGIKLTDAHGAMNDVEATTDIFRWFMKKLRSESVTKVAESIKRKKGQDFFEFKCAQ